MTQPALVPPMDQANALLAPTDAQLALGMVQTPQGQRMALTIRTASTTMTVFLARDDADVWAENIRVGAGQMSRLIVPSGPVRVPPPPAG